MAGRAKPLAQGTKGLSRGTGLARSAGLAPGAGLQRGKSLEQGSKGLTRSAPMARAVPPPRSAEVPASARMPRAVPASAKPRPWKPPKTAGPRVAAEVRAAVLARSGGRCEVGITDACRRRGRSLTSPEGTNQHHRHPGGMGGSKRAEIHAAAGLMQVCGSGNTSGCHGAIESARTVAYERGWLVKRGQDPADVPVQLHDGRTVLLAGDGYAPAPDGVAGGP